MRIIELQPIKEWQEKEGTKITGRIWLYIGNLHVAICTPVRNQTADIQKYICHEMLYGVLDIATSPLVMDEIKTEIDCQLKEFACKFIKKLTTLKPVKNGNIKLHNNN